jgi:hypothetical protein
MDTWTGAMEPAFVAERRRALEMFLKRIALHPILSQSPDVGILLDGDDETLRKARDGLIPPAPAPGAAEGKKKEAKPWYSAIADVTVSAVSAM